MKPGGLLAVGRVCVGLRSLPIRYPVSTLDQSMNGIPNGLDSLNEATFVTEKQEPCLGGIVVHFTLFKANCLPVITNPVT